MKIHAKLNSEKLLQRCQNILLNFGRNFCWYMVFTPTISNKGQKRDLTLWRMP